MPDAQPAASSPAEPSAVVDLKSLSQTQRDHWRLTGDLPSDTPTDDTPPDADSAPAPVEVPPVSTETTLPPASEPGPVSSKPRTEARFQEILADRDRERTRARDLETRLAALERPPVPAVPAASAPAPVESYPPFDEQWLAAHPGQEWQDWQNGNIAFTARAEARRLFQDERQQQAVHATIQSKLSAFQQRYQAATAADPQFEAKISPVIGQAIPTEVLRVLHPTVERMPINDIAQEIVEAANGPAISVFLSEHPEELQRLTRLTTPQAVIREMAKLDAQLTAKPSRTPSASTVSTALPPPTTLGKQTSTPVDELEAAVASGDFRRYRAAQNAREMAMRG